MVLRIKEIPGGKIIIGIGSFDPIHTYFHNHQSSPIHSLPLAPPWDHSAWLQRPKTVSMAEPVLLRSLQGPPEGRLTTCSLLPGRQQVVAQRQRRWAILGGFHVISPENKHKKLRISLDLAKKDRDDRVFHQGRARCQMIGAAVTGYRGHWKPGWHLACQ